MTVVPRYMYPAGTQMTLHSRRFVLNTTTDLGYECTDLETGEVSVIPFLVHAEYLKLPGAAINTQIPLTGNRMRARLGGVSTSRLLAEFQQEHGRFHMALCQGIGLLRDKLRLESGDPTFDLSIRMLAKPEHRKFIKEIAETLFGEKIHLSSVMGGKRAVWVMYQARTLMMYFRRYEDIQPEEDPLDALTPLDHLKGHDTPRICTTLKLLMAEAWEQIGFDKKGTYVSNVANYLGVLIGEENKRRQRNELPPLIVPSHKTLTKFRDYLLSPTEQMIATKGERFARNKRGRGSTDIRALMIGELVEVDECRMSLVASAKLKGFWERLSQSDKDTLEEIDKLIRERLSVLIMVDVATRNSPAWIISDQPRTEATLALYRMATRSKAREKLIYGCEGDPMPPIGIGHVKNDNGVGLRNAAVKQGLLGIGATITDARTYNATDKPYVEAMFGTLESVLLKLIHGYTGRKAGELPGYDAIANGVLDIDELYGILTRFMIDDYPSMRHMGFGMGGRRPAVVYEEVNASRGIFCELDPNVRRIHLGWEVKVIPSHEGVKVFGRLWYNSTELQEKTDKYRGKVSVFVDPDDVTHATVLIPGEEDPVVVTIQNTVFADLTLPEVLEIMAAWRKEHPDVTVIYEDRLMRTRRRMFDQLRSIGVERKLARSYSTVRECQMKGEVVFAGARIETAGQLPGTIAPGNLTAQHADGAIFKLGASNNVIEGVLANSDEEYPSELVEVQSDDADEGGQVGPVDHPQSSVPKPKTTRKSVKNQAKTHILGRPSDMGTLE